MILSKLPTLANIEDALEYSCSTRVESWERAVRHGLSGNYQKTTELRDEAFAYAIACFTAVWKALDRTFEDPKDKRLLVSELVDRLRSNGELRARFEGAYESFVVRERDRRTGLGQGNDAAQALISRGVRDPLLLDYGKVSTKWYLEETVESTVTSFLRYYVYWNRSRLTDGGRLDRNTIPIENLVNEIGAEDLPSTSEEFDPERGFKVADFQIVGLYCESLAFDLAEKQEKGERKQALMDMMSAVDMIRLLRHDSTRNFPLVTKYHHAIQSAFGVIGDTQEFLDPPELKFERAREWLSDDSSLSNELYANGFWLMGWVSAHSSYAISNPDARDFCRANMPEYPRGHDGSKMAPQELARKIGQPFGEVQWLANAWCGSWELIQHFLEIKPVFVDLQRHAPINVRRQMSASDMARFGGYLKTRGYVL